MSDIALPVQPVTTPWSTRAFDAAVKAWYVVTATGHWIFLAYIVAVFYPPIAGAGLEGLRGLHLPSGFREGDTLGNIAAASHVLLAAIVIGGGPLQMLPALRNRFPAFHRALGRAYLLAAVVSAVGGLYMVWTRGTVGNMLGHVTISVDAVLILVFAAAAVRFAVARRITEHRRWALRLFMAASAVLFFRIGLMGWATLTGGIGIDFDSFTGPFLTVLGFAQFLLPLAMLEWYFHCQRHPNAAGRLAFTGVLALLTGYMAVGIFAATMGMWLPRM